MELVGPAGCGKTTLLERLLLRSDAMMPGVPLSLGTRALTLLRRSALLLPLLLREACGDRRVAHQARSVVYLEGWLRSLRLGAAGPDRVVVFDHGPLFRLALLGEFGSARPRRGRFPLWWERARDEWGELLDLVVWLDAPDEVLLHRIATRDRAHAVKGRPEREGREFLARYRRAYENLLGAMAAHRRVRLMRFDTSLRCADEITEVLVAELRSLQVAIPVPESTTCPRIPAAE